jgi:hypothetical protein
MRNRKPVFFLISSLILLSLACGFGIVPSVIATSTDSASASQQTQQSINQAVQDTFAVQTQMEVDVAQTVAALPSQTPQFTFTPTGTLLPSDTPQPTATFTPETVQVSVSVATNCRSGPGTVYDLLGALQVGQSALVIGKNQSGDTWIVQLPGSPTVTCWLWGQYAALSGNTANLPVMTPPPTPTPQPAFEVRYSGWELCLGKYSVNFKITNTGGITWESDTVRLTDNTVGVTTVVLRNSFPNYVGCNILQEDQNLAPGETGITTSSSFNFPIAGHQMQAVVQVCSLADLAGTCIEKTIDFTP